MKANELMCGDWVLYKGKPIKVISVDGSQDLIYYYDEEDYTEYPIGVTNIEPIPITTEILLANDFYREDNVGYLYEDGYGADLIVDIWDSEIRVLEDRDVAFKKRYYWNGLMVHRLQHVIKELEIKKEIKL